MEVIEKIIANLLFEKEFVIVPGFGAFVTHNFSSEVNNATYLFRPPSKRISFRQEIKEGDEALIAEVSSQCKVLRSEAIAMIRSAVSAWKKEINRGEKLFLPSLGRFYRGDEGSILFTPNLEVNYSRESFGLPIFRTPGAFKEMNVTQSVQKAVVTHLNNHPEVVTKSSKDWRRIAAVAVPVVGLIYLGSLKPDFNIDTAGFFDFDPLKYSRTIDLPAEEETLPENTFVAYPETIVEKEAPKTAVEKVVDNSEKATEELEPKTLELDRKDVDLDAPYHIVVGSFGEPQNARAFVESLHEIGLKASVLNENSKLQKVSVEGFASHKEATMALRAYKLKVTSSAWIYHK